MKTLRARYAYVGGAYVGRYHLHKGDFVPLCGAETDPRLMWDEIEIDVQDGRLCPQCRHIFNRYEVQVTERPDSRSTSDRIYGYRITDKMHPLRGKAEVLAYCQSYVQRSCSREQMMSWADPETLEFSQVSPGVWRYRVKEAYTG